ncbi:MAG: zinc ABC transporter substrate-binding protein [Magnetococcales bacterium]|nr:zinc ABC transporter substrate-binding protein [Magnetococcales bacterium]
MKWRGPSWLGCWMALVSLAMSWVSAQAWGGEAPRAVVSIKPIHGLVAGVMQGVGEPKLLMRASASPHSYALRPSEADMLRQAGVIFWVGEDLETFLIKPMLQLATHARLVPLSQAPGVKLLPNRRLGVAAEESPIHDGDDGHHHGTQDMHVWLSPDNAVAMVEEIRRSLSEWDPGHAQAYKVNAQRLTQRIEVFAAVAKKRLAAVSGKKFIVFHDAYHYFEDYFGLHGVSSLSVDPARPVSAKRLSEVRASIKDFAVVCLFSEPQFEPAMVDAIVRDTQVKKGVLDPLGTDTPEGEEGWFVLMERLVTGLVGCLQ